MATLRNKFSITFIIQLSNVIVGIIVSILLANLLGAEGRGKIEAIRGYGLFVATVGSFSIPAALRYYLARDKNIESSYILSGLIIVVGLGFTESIILAIALQWLLDTHDPFIQHWAMIYTLIIPIHCIALFGAAAQQSIGRLKRWYILMLLQNILPLAALLILRLLGLVNIQNIVMLFLATNGIWALMFLFSLQYSRCNFAITLVNLLTHGARFSVAAIPEILSSSLAKIVPIWFLANAELGNYAVAITMASMLLLFAFPFKTIGFVSIREEKNQLVQVSKVMKFFCVAQIVMTIVIPFYMILMPGIVRLLLPVDYLPSIEFAQILILALGLAMLRSVLSVSLQAMDHIKPSLVGSIVNILILLLASSLFFQLFGIRGLAFAVLIAITADLTMVVVMTSRLFGMPMRKFWGLRINIINQVIRHA